MNYYSHHKSNKSKTRFQAYGTGFFLPARTGPLQSCGPGPLGGSLTIHVPTHVNLRPDTAIVYYITASLYHHSRVDTLRCGIYMKYMIQLMQTLSQTLSF